MCRPAPRLSTSQLNGAVEDIVALRGPSSPTAQKVKVYYATQTDVKPPTIVLFVNNKDLITVEYQRFFVRQLRERLPFSEVPIRLHVRGHHRSNDRLEDERGGGKGGKTAGLEGREKRGGRLAKSRQDAPHTRPPQHRLTRIC